MRNKMARAVLSTGLAFVILSVGCAGRAVAADTDPDDPNGAEHYLAGLAQERSGKIERAAELFHALSRNKGLLQPYAAIRYAELLTRRAGHEADAEKILRQYADAAAHPGPWNRLAQARLAALLARQNKRSEAEQYWSRAFSGLGQVPWFMEDVEWQRVENLLAAPETAMAAMPYLRPRAESILILRRKQAADALVRLPDPHARALGARAMLRSGMMDETKALFERESLRLDSGGMGPLDWRPLQQALSFADPPGAEARASLAGILQANREHPWLEAWLTFCMRSAAGRKAWDTARMFADALMDVSSADDTNTVEAVYWLAGRMKEAKESARAEELYRLVAGRYSKHSRVFWCWMNIGDLARDAKNWEQAAAGYAAAAEATSRADYQARAWWRQAEALGNLDRPQARNDALRKAAACAPGAFEAHRALARLRDPETHALPGAPAGLMAYRPNPHRINPEFHPVTDAQKRVWFFARHGLEEGEWETLHLLLSLPEGPERLETLRFLCDAGYMHTVINMAVGDRAERAGRDDTTLCLYYPVAYWPLVSRMAREYGLDPFLILAVSRQESTFRPSLISRAGAVGVMQVMPATARWMVSKDAELPRDAASRLMEPEVSIRLGAAYLRQMLDRFNGNLVYAVAAYNGGPGNCSKWIKSFGQVAPETFIEAIPLEETRDYVKKVLGNLATYHTLWTLP